MAPDQNLESRLESARRELDEPLVAL